MVASVVLGVHLALDRGRDSLEQRRTDEPASDVEAVELPAALAGEPPGERLLIRSEQVDRETCRLEPHVEAARAAIDAPEHEGRFLRDGREAHHHEACHATVRMRCRDDGHARRPGARDGAERSVSTEGSARPLIQGY